MTSRHEFLATVRHRVQASTGHSPTRPVDPVAHPVPPVHWSVDLTDLVGVFTTAATTAGAEVFDGRTPERRADVLRELKDDGLRRVVVSRDPEVDAIREDLRATGFDVDPGHGPQAAASADLGVTGAAHGLALTGSLVVDSRRSGTRLASLLPPVHLALLDRTRLLPDLGALLRGLGAPQRKPLPSNLVCITGHSRSADIELELTPGVHGPRRLFILLT